MTKGGWVYIMADRYRGAIYVGVTADLVRRGSNIAKESAQIMLPNTA